MQLLTDGTKNNPLLGFCLSAISRFQDNWPPEELVLAEDFVTWLGFKPFMTRDALRQMCQSKGVTLSFEPLPDDVRGLNCSFQDKKEIVVSRRELAPFADAHTLFHEFREMIEHSFIDLGYATIGASDSLEIQAELFAMSCRFKAAETELPAFIQKTMGIEKRWERYLLYLLLAIFGASYFFSCIYMRQLEDIGSEVQRQRYVHT